MTASVSNPPGDLDATLQALVRYFDRDPVENRKLIRELLQSDQRAFYSSALGILKNPDESRGCQFLVTLLVAFDLLLPALCDPALTREQALALARSAARVDSLADVALARSLADSSGADDGPVPERDAGRLMEILGEISDGTRILPSLMRMLRHPNPYLRSKAVKMIGRGSRSVRWVQNRLNESDPRIRANAVEALWGLDNEEARALLATAARDGNNRVAGNALLALYWLGDNGVIPEILRMAEHESALFRSTAAWAMGESGDPRFTETLARLMRDGNAAVRSRALSALGRIKTAIVQSRHGNEWVVTGLLQDPGLQRNTRRVQVAVARNDGREYARVLPTQFIVSENGQPIVCYRVTERVVAEAMSVVFAVPRSAVTESAAWAQAILACRTWKRPSDLWAVCQYLTGSGEEGPASLDEPPRFTSSTDSLESGLFQPAPRSECHDVWRTVWRAIRTDQGQNRGKRHVILFSDCDPWSVAGDGLVSAVMASRTLVQVITSSRSPKIEDFCRRARLNLQYAPTPEEVSHCLEMAYLNLLAHYDIAWQSTAPELENLKIRVNAPSGWGEAAIAVAAPGQNE